MMTLPGFLKDQLTQIQRRKLKLTQSFSTIIATIVIAMITTVKLTVKNVKTNLEEDNLEASLEVKTVLHVLVPTVFVLINATNV